MRSEKAGQNKEALRREALRRRPALPEEERRRAGERILQTLCSLAQYRNARRVLIYASFGDEVPTRELMRTALEEGKQVFCPRVEGAGKMSFYRIWQIGELTPGFRGILEPPLEEERKFRNPAKGDLIIMPGAAFDRQCGRLGYGGGYYDRFLQTVETADALAAETAVVSVAETAAAAGTEHAAGRAACFKAALCFSCQLLEAVMQESTDIRPDLIIAECDTIRQQEEAGAVSAASFDGTWNRKGNDSAEG